MKTIKFLLAVGTITILCVCVWIGWDTIAEPDRQQQPKNKYKKSIESEIDSLNKSPASVFCPKLYKEIQYNINEYHKQKLFDDANDSNNLSKKLYYAYAPKFIESTMYVFNGSEWKNDDLKFIENEVKALKKSRYLTSGTVTSNDFQKIENILKKYYEITGFISTCNKFSYSNYDIIVERPSKIDKNQFPDVSDKIKKAQDYLNLDNNYVKNCVRLKKDLEAIPQILFEKHINYLQTKIQQNGGKYENYNIPKDYADLIFIPLQIQVEDLKYLKDSIYKIDYDAYYLGYQNLDNQLKEYETHSSDYYKQNRGYY